jgi:hypothetical protein
MPGRLVLKVEERGVARWARVNEGVELAMDEVRLRHRLTRCGLRSAMLVGLRDDAQEAFGADRKDRF